MSFPNYKYSLKYCTCQIHQVDDTALFCFSSIIFDDLIEGNCNNCMCSTTGCVHLCRRYSSICSACKLGNALLHEYSDG